MNYNPRLPNVETTGNWILAFRERFYRLWSEHATEHAAIEPQYGIWTPAITFATPGNLSVSYAAQVGLFSRVGKRMTLDFNVLTNVYTQTTSAGALELTGIPQPVATITGYQVATCIEFAGISKAGYTAVAVNASSGNSFLTFDGTGMSGASGIVAADVPSGGTIALRGQITYQLD